MDRRQEQAVDLVDQIGDQRARLRRGIDRLLDVRRIDAQERRRLLGKLRARHAAVALAQRLLEHMAEAGAQAERRIARDAEARGQLVGRGEADAADVLRKAVGIGAHHLDRALAVRFVDPRRAQGAEAVRVQIEHDLAHGLLLAPGLGDPSGEPAADARHLAQARRLVLDHLEHLVAERLHQLLGKAPADALDHARGEIGLHALGGAGRHDGDGAGAELRAEIRAGLPAALGAHHLAGCDLRAFADEGRGLALLGELDPQHAKAGGGIVEHHPLDQPRQALARRPRRTQREGLHVGSVAVSMRHGARNLTFAP